MPEPCNFATLRDYHSGASGINTVKVPVFYGNNIHLTSGEVISSDSNYNSITTVRPHSCSRFSNITNAYSNIGNNCNQSYIRRICN